MVLIYPIHRLLFFVSGGNFAVSAISETILFLGLAFLCETEQGDFMRPLISVLYYNGMIYLFNYVSGSYIYAFTDAFSSLFSFLKIIEGVLILFWAFFYYRIARKITIKAPLSFSLLTILTPVAGLAIIVVSSNAASSLLGTGINVYLHGALFGTLIIVLNMCVFYLYIKLSVAHESLIFARDLAHTPPVWTSEQGLSAAFIEKYEITPREREVIEAMLLGKTDKEISIKLYIAVNTVQAHLKRIYRKTGASGRFALSALVRGS